MVRLWHGIEYSASGASCSNCTTGGKTAEQSILVSETMAVAERTVGRSGSDHEEGARGRAREEKRKGD